MNKETHPITPQKSSSKSAGEPSSKSDSQQYKQAGNTYIHTNRQVYNMYTNMPVIWEMACPENIHTK